ncbi:MAG: 5'/3'-nucleotidase SurE, partial [Pseudonocardia sp.]
MTNDDGIDSEGLLALAVAARDAGLDVIVAAPRDQASGASAGIIAA